MEPQAETRVTACPQRLRAHERALAGHPDLRRGSGVPRVTGPAPPAALQRGQWRPRAPGPRIRQCRPGLKRTLLVCGTLVSLARCARGHRGGRKQRPWTCCDRNSASMRGTRRPAARGDSLKYFHKRISSTHVPQQWLLCGPAHGKAGVLGTRPVHGPCARTGPACTQRGPSVFILRRGGRPRAQHPQRKAARPCLEPPAPGGAVCAASAMPTAPLPTARRPRRLHDSPGKWLRAPRGLLLGVG